VFPKAAMAKPIHFSEGMTIAVIVTVRPIVGTEGVALILSTCMSRAPDSRLGSLWVLHLSVFRGFPEHQRAYGSHNFAQTIAHLF